MRALLPLCLVWGTLGLALSTTRPRSLLEESEGEVAVELEGCVGDKLEGFKAYLEKYNKTYADPAEFLHRCTNYLEVGREVER